MHAEFTILHLVPALFGDEGVTGGAERYAFELARAMAEVTPTLLVSYGRKNEERQMGPLRVRTLGRPHLVRGQAANPFHWGLIRELRRASVVHCHQQHVLASSFAAAYCRLTGRRVFVSDMGGGGWDVSAYISTDRWYHGHLHISEYSRRIFGQQDFSRAHVIWGGVDTAKFSPEPAVERTQTVLYVGRLLPHKGVNYLVEALPPGLRLRIVGQPYDERFDAELHRLAESKDVVFDCQCDDAALVQAYRSALCVVLPSVYQDLYGGKTSLPELLGQTLLEGMACGAPVLCTNVASLPEIVRDGVDGFVVSPNDPGALQKKLVWLRDHSVEAHALGQAGCQRVQTAFTWPQVVRHCLEIYGVESKAAKN